MMLTVEKRKLLLETATTDKPLLQTPETLRNNTCNILEHHSGIILSMVYSKSWLSLTMALASKVAR